jgi:MFS family permease
MGLLGPLAGLLGIETDALLQRAKESAVAIAAIGVFVLIGVTFLLVALYTALDGWVGPIWAPLIIAAVALVIALILYIALRIQAAALKRRQAERKVEAETTALVASAALTALPELFHSSLVRNVGLPIALYAAFLFFTAPKKSGPTESRGSGRSAER